MSRNNSICGITVDWGSRKETAAACADRLASMLQKLAYCAPEFRNWHQIGEEANMPLSPDAGNRPALVVWLESGLARRELDNQPFPGAGFSKTASNGINGPKHSMMHLSVGDGNCEGHDNGVTLFTEPYAPGNADLFSLSTLKPVLLAMVAAWEPVRGGIVPAEIFNHVAPSPRDRPPRVCAGWVTYLSRRARLYVSAPDSALCEELPGGGLLMTVTKDRFDIDDPHHVAVLDAIQAALAPLNRALISGPLRG